MAGFIVVTNMDEDSAMKLSRSVARDLGFTVETIDDRTFQACKGSLAVSILLGAFIAYCNFTVEINRGRYEGDTEIVVNRNSPWWTGIIGVSRVKKRAKELAEEIADAIKHDGGRVRDEKEF